MLRQSWKKVLLWVVFLFVSLAGAQIVFGQEYPSKPITLIVPSGSGKCHRHPDARRDQRGSGLPWPTDRRETRCRAEGGRSALMPPPRPPPTGIRFWQAVLRGVPGFRPSKAGPKARTIWCRYAGSTIARPFSLPKPDAPFKTYKQMMEWIKANPNKLTASTPGPWTPPDVVWKYLMKATGTSFRIVQFQGGGEATVALLGGHVDAGTAIPSMAMPYKGTGKMTFLLFLDEKRHPDFPDVPTSGEEGLDRVINTLGCAWRGILVPKGHAGPDH